MTTTVEYTEFLRAKQQIAEHSGFEIDPAEVNEILKPHQRDAVVWAVGGGRRALFESFGLGKTMQQLEICRLVLDRLGGGRGLIVCPLGVRQEFVRDGRLLGIDPRFIRRVDEASDDGIYLTNYESVRDGKLDPTGFAVVSLDEAAILRGFGGTKTFREFMRLYEGSAAYRFVATATPSPNDYLELLAYAAFLAKQLRLAFERARGEASEDKQRDLAHAVAVAERLRSWSAQSALADAGRGGVRR